MRIKLLKKMYRQTNEAVKRGDIFQQRPCPFYNEMHRIYSGTEDANGSSLLSNSQSLLKEDDEDDDDIEEEMKNFEQENVNHIQPNDSTKDKLTEAIDRLIQYQQQNEVEILFSVVVFKLKEIFIVSRLAGINILNNKLILSYNVDKKIVYINFS